MPKLVEIKSGTRLSNCHGNKGRTEIGLQRWDSGERGCRLENKLSSTRPHQTFLKSIRTGSL